MTRGVLGGRSQLVPYHRVWDNDNPKDTVILYMGVWILDTANDIAIWRSMRGPHWGTRGKPTSIFNHIISIDT